MLPIAYGRMAANGTLVSSTSNVVAERTALGIYSIKIAGFTDISRLLVMVQPRFTSSRTAQFVSTNSVLLSILVQIDFVGVGAGGTGVIQNPSDTTFDFLVFDPR